jgi:hypothetical protein
MDGVIIDSIEECYSVSKDAYYESKSFIYSEDRYKKIFFKYRGHVRPPYEYFCLHDAIEHFYDKQFDDLQFINFFNNNSKKFQYDDKAAFEETFFTIRLDHQNNDFDSWIKMNPLTSFGETLKSKNNANTYVITTKNMQAAKKILNFYKIGVDKIYSKKLWMLLVSQMLSLLMTQLSILILLMMIELHVILLIGDMERTLTTQHTAS